VTERTISSAPCFLPAGAAGTPRQHPGGIMNYNLFSSFMKKRIKQTVKGLAACCTALVCVIAATAGYAKDFTFSWSANPEPVDGYRLYYKSGGVAAPPFDGTMAVEGPSPVSLGKITSFTLTGLDDSVTYHFALTAFNSNGESAYSEIITVAATGTSPAPVINRIRIL
jgi:hypothetical protein